MEHKNSFSASYAAAGFSKVRSGQVRVLMGSTFKMGAGMNVRATRS